MLEFFAVTCPNDATFLFYSEWFRWSQFRWRNSTNQSLWVHEWSWGVIYVHSVMFNWAARVAQWWEHSPLTSVARVQILSSKPYVGWVCCWFSPLLREVFLLVLLFSPVLKSQHFKIPIQYVTLFGKTGLNENRVQMHFNEFQMHLECITTLENDSQRICNVPQFIHETPPMFLNVQEWSWNDFQCISNALEMLHKACLENCKIRMKIIIFNSPLEWQRDKLNKFCVRST